MKIEYSKHAKERAGFRKISKRRILITIGLPDKTLSSFRDRKVIQKKFGSKTLEVVIKVENDTMMIVTAYYLISNESKIRQKN